MLVYDENVPILLILYNRNDTLKKVFSQIKKVKPKRLYIAADGPKNIKDAVECDEARAIVSCVDWECEVLREYQKDNLGCDKHCFLAVSWFFEHEEEGIVLEDDCVPSISFFGFCSSLLKKYRDDDRIGHITGSNFQFGIQRGDGSYYFSNLTHVGGWAGWRRIWRNQNKVYDYKQFEKFDYLSNLPSHAPYFAYWNRHYELSCRSQDVGWDFKYAFMNLINSRLSIIPNANLVSNIGCFNKATHCVDNYPFADIKIEELDEIVHPSFFLPDIEADLYTQSVEFGITYDSLCVSKDYEFLKNRLIDSSVMQGKKLRIPKIIHQIYEDLEGPPAYLKKISLSWKEKNPDWQYRFWNKNDIDVFLNKYFPEYIESYNSFQYDVQRWDVIRYLILYKIGGLYVDMDYECLENITPLLCNIECAMGLEPEGNIVRFSLPYVVGNAFMASVPYHPYFKDIINEAFDKNNLCSLYDFPQEFIINTTGPYMTTRVYEKSKNKHKVTLIPAELVAPLNQYEIKKLINNIKSKDMMIKIEKSFAVHYFFGSWLNQIIS